MVASAGSPWGRRCAVDIGGRLGWLCVLFLAFVSPCVSVRSGVAPPCVFLRYIGVVYGTVMYRTVGSYYRP